MFIEFKDTEGKFIIMRSEDIIYLQQLQDTVHKRWRVGIATIELGFEVTFETSQDILKQWRDNK